jgi:tripartite-type tricarboxylate transporter receptor subunit TctC
VRLVLRSSLLSNSVRFTRICTVGNNYAVLGLPLVQSFIKDGRLLALAVRLPQRSPLLPEVPVMVEVLPGIERGASTSILAPGKTPRHVLNQISKEVGQITALPDVRDRLQAIGFVPAPSTPEEQDKIRRTQIEALTRLVKDAGLRPK